MRSLSASELLALPIRLHGIRLGRPVDLLLDAGLGRALGFVVDCGDEAPRFLPYAASQPGADEIAVGSALMLLDDVGFYSKHGASFRALAGAEIRRRGRPAGTLADVRLDGGGDVTELELELDGRRLRVPAAGCTVMSSAATAA
jgi:hypothetical protein